MTAAPQEALPPGSVIGGKYRIVRRIGEGGMSSVYEAENELTNKRVAIKWLHPTLASSLDAVRRMLREAQASARIRHPHVVDVYDVGQEGNSVFLVMEYLEGETLRDVLSARRLSIPELISVLVPAMRGTAAAHAQGIVHRDIKPDNIFLSRVLDYAPVPKVLDFGISKFEVPGTDAATLTQSGIAMGTPLYMSFEQLSGAKDVDGRADVYAFGVILYEALTGKPPFLADSFAGLAVKVATQTPAPPSALSHELPAELDAIVMKAIAREREDRYPSLDALVLDLEPFGPAEMRTSTPRSSGPASYPPSKSLAPVAFAQTIKSPSDGHPSARSKRSRAVWLVLTLLAIVGASAFFWAEPALPANEASEPREGRVVEPARTMPAETTVESPSGVEQVPAQPVELESPLPVVHGSTAKAPDAEGHRASRPHSRRREAPVAAKTPAVGDVKPAFGATETSDGTAAPEPGKAESPKAEPAPTAPRATTPEESAATEKDKRFRAGQPRIDQF